MKDENIMGNIFSVGTSGLAAAQIGITTTGHNIANAATPGYNRQVVVQTSGGGQAGGNGFLGSGTDVAAINRVYDTYTAGRVNASQTSKTGFDTYVDQVSQINNLLADAKTGLAPAIQDFFNNVQGLSANPGGAAQRQTLLSSGQSLAARFQSIDGQLSDISEGVNKQITSTVGTINSYAQQIATLNDAIQKATANANGAQPNDLLDQRDAIVTALSKEVKVTVNDQPGIGYDVTIGNGQPIVIGNTTFTLQTAASPTDTSKLEVAYKNGATVSLLPESAITGGTLGGLFDFRTNSLDPARNELGRVALGIATTVNDQSRLGLDQTGAAGQNFFTVTGPVVTPNTGNTGSGVIGATISSVSALTASDYSVAYSTGPANYKITRLSDNFVSNSATLPVTQDGITFAALSGTPAGGDNYLVRPTVSAGAGINVALSDKTQIAAAAPIVTGSAATNGGVGKISAGSVNASYLATPLTGTVTLAYNSTTGKIDSVPTGTTGLPQTYTSGSNITFGGISFTITGNLVNGDQFTVGKNTSGVGDGRNAIALASLQTANTLDNGTSTFAGAFAQLVTNVGNKTREVTANAAAEGSLLSSVTAIQQSQSGVNLDEEAANLLRYQQAYQASGKVLQIAGTLFDVLLTLGR
ncbi:flagellar hook-associated protein 1 FlgK [Actimicrobium sp. GrIS 1.19]|uniref:flagellar hook-associated protein FlgK n=1 Tax=Actimicrobium sp. GrIS 1.19 TaxID=3071708 RepID=UPI002E02673C|nr:flagellar hook-associated protein 1 FlgK [Actimicrobium sp. GrIS 1.19]